MLIIRQAQLEAFVSDRASEFPSKIAAYLRDECPREAEALNDEDLGNFITANIKRAGATYDLSSEWDLCRFCWLALLHGPDFDSNEEWAEAILTGTEEGTSPTSKMDELEFYHLNHVAPKKEKAARP